MTEELFREDSYLRACDATVTAVDDRRVYLDRTVFYPTGGGQPGDTGTLRDAGGRESRVIETVKTDQGIAHVLDDGAVAPAAGDRVTAEIDWTRRYRLMKMHTCMHVLSHVVPLGVTGGSIRDGSARLDFDALEPLDKEDIDRRLNDAIRTGAAVSKRWISDEELDAQPELVKTLSVQPPRGSGRIRLIEIDGLDLQPCGGTHLENINEIGPVRVKKIEKKGKHNRRVIVEFDD
ncbi:MAG: alanyl-tRNA editing protein [Gammaproteobacteria bacterium]|nr:alanyl-tRNA editing protein [Gammaproteobacteria bacterium]